AVGADGHGPNRLHQGRRQRQDHLWPGESHAHRRLGPLVDPELYEGQFRGRERPLVLGRHQWRRLPGAEPVEGTLYRLTGGDAWAVLSALDELLVRAHVELAIQLLAGVADKALVGQNRLDVLLVGDRVLAIDLDLGNRIDLGVLLLLGEGQGGEDEEYRGV